MIRIRNTAKKFQDRNVSDPDQHDRPNAHRALHEPEAGPAGQVPRPQEVLERFFEAAAEGRAPREHIGGEREGGTVPLGQLQDVGAQHNQPVRHFLLANKCQSLSRSTFSSNFLFFSF